MTIIMRRFEFDYGHRVLGHGGKCASLHGHRGVADVALEASFLDELGMVVDFGVMKDFIGEWIDEHWDHTMLFHPADPFLKLLDNYGFLKGPSDLFGPKKPFIMPDKMNPTAENMVSVLADVVRSMLPAMPGDVQLHSIRLWETPNCSAEWNA